MYKNGIIDFVITEDSDLFLFGVKKSLVKFDATKCCGNFINLEDINDYKSTHKGKKKTLKNGDLCLFLKKFKKLEEFIHVGVLSGCDYVSSLYGIGIKKSVKYITENRKIDRLLHTLMRQKDKKAPKDYRIQFKRAVLTFLHQTVYDLRSKRLTYLNPLTDDVDAYLVDLNKHLSRLPVVQQYNVNDKRPTVYDKTLNFLGKHVDEETATLIAEGKIDAKSLKPRHLCVINAPPIRNDEREENNDQNGSIFEKRATKKKRGGTSQPKMQKYFGKLSDADIEIGDGLDGNLNLNEMFSQFLCPTHMDSKSEVAETNSTQSTECEEKEIASLLHSDNEEEQENMHKPLKRLRKRNRSAIESEIDATPFRDLKNSNNRISRRKLNDGSSQMNHSKNSFFVGMTPRNRLKSVDRSDLNASIISDLMSCSKSNSNKIRRRSWEETEKETENKANSKNNPFSIHHDNDFYDIDDDEDDDMNDEIMKYSQSSQSQSEKQMEDILQKTQQQRQREHERKDEDEEIIILKQEPKSTKQMSKKRKKFNPPRFKNGPPPKINSKKKRKVSNKKSSAKLKKKKGGPKQMNLFAMWNKT